MRKGTERLFPTDYEKFKESMLDAAYEEELPVVLQLEDIKDFTLKDIQDLFYDFRTDTSLDINGTLFMCPDCGRLHLLLEVDYPETDEKTLLQ